MIIASMQSIRYKFFVKDIFTQLAHKHSDDLCMSILLYFFMYSIMLYGINVINFKNPKKMY